MNNDNSGTDSDDLPIISMGGWRVGAVYRSQRARRVRQFDEADRVIAVVKVPEGSYWLCTGFSEGHNGNEDIAHWLDRYADLDVYACKKDGEYQFMMRTKWYAADEAFRPEQNSFELLDSPLVALALVGTNDYKSIIIRMSALTGPS